jgi:hypothetical protein
LYRAIVRQRDLLAVHPDYFLLTGGVERWLYRLARKSVPEKAEPPEFRFRLETLFEVSGLTGRLRDFRSKIERIADEGPLPEYSVRIERDSRDEMVTLYRDPAKPGRAAHPTTAEHVRRVPARLLETAESEPPTPPAMLQLAAIGRRLELASQRYGITGEAWDRLARDYAHRGPPQPPERNAWHAVKKELARNLEQVCQQLAIAEAHCSNNGEAHEEHQMVSEMRDFGDLTNWLRRSIEKGRT